MPGVELIEVSGKEIIYIDYTNCDSGQMIEIFDRAKKMVLNKKEGNCLLLTNFEGAYITSSFMRHAEKEMVPIKHLITKNSFIGMTFPQRMILKGFSLFIRKDVYVAFEDREKALEYLICQS
ncbi:MAG TPA: hypothetical protein VGQ59_05585 [Cyclobacteriaceae bacterium]|jgi:hypothetical protein|nr:hypothetical protein [Cyclobacteriaceae bacterium]